MTSDHVSSALDAAKIEAAVLDAAETKSLLVRLRERLGVDVTARAPWDHSSAPEGSLQPDGWQLIPRYVGTAPCLMFLEGANTIWKFKSGSDLLRVLKECPAFEFYVCDREASYLLCSNHHDFVVGWGAATSWVNALAARR